MSLPAASWEARFAIFGRQEARYLRRAWPRRGCASCPQMTTHTILIPTQILIRYGGLTFRDGERAEKDTLGVWCYRVCHRCYQRLAGRAPGY